MARMQMDLPMVRFSALARLNLHHCMYLPPWSLGKPTLKKSNARGHSDAISKFLSFSKLKTKRLTYKDQNSFAFRKGNNRL